MAQLIVRNLEDGVKSKLRQRARRHGHSTEEEVRDILRNVVREEEQASAQPLGTRLKSRFSRVGLESPITELRGQRVRPVNFPS